ncbi:MAG: alpha/beta hydrolase [Deltaproteobacteria bacterium]|nr:alpha/beta hydrolase [Deltaproteobacteria bacterium]MBW1952650.1 alpha/beta hydrolase [Deltaproteobacteria bacterium]MBW1986222.1 alpha/beta hydrolase [Deltaproteobacteria bacterium]MBW2134119.1 alpha/beta hydrolase [Deltaproteobacteria bacterium]
MEGQFSEKGIVFFPDPFMLGSPADYGLEYEEVLFTTDDQVQLHGWWVPQPQPSPTLLWFHGNAGNISHRLENLLLLWRKVGLQIFIFDYREYGRSQGRITREGTYLDASAAYDYVTARLGIASENLILFGRSLGSALAVNLAVKKPCRALIVESAFTSSEDMFRLYAPFVSWRPTVPYDNLGKISQVRVPLLIIHGVYDEVIPFKMGERLFAAANPPKFFYPIPQAHHNDTYMIGGEAYFLRLKTFVFNETGKGES